MGVLQPNNNSQDKTSGELLDVDFLSIDDAALSKLATMLLYVANTQLGFTEKIGEIKVLENTECKELADKTLSFCVRVPNKTSVCAYIPANQWCVMPTRQMKSFSDRILEKWSMR